MLVLASKLKLLGHNKNLGQGERSGSTWEFQRTSVDVRKYASLNKITPAVNTPSSGRIFFFWRMTSHLFNNSCEEEMGASISELAARVEQCHFPFQNPSMGITVSRLRARNTKADFSLELRVSWEQVTGMSFHFHSCTPKTEPFFLHAGIQQVCRKQEERNMNWGKLLQENWRQS